MSAKNVHYELFAKRSASSGWTLQCASEDRARVLAEADELMADKRACAVRVVKETQDPETLTFSSVVVMTRGLVDDRPATAAKPQAPACTSLADLYADHARERIARLLEGWLKRRQVTAFELMHRPDLAADLDDSGDELQHAVQKIAIPEAQARGGVLHEVILHFQNLAQQAIDRLRRDGKRNLFPLVDPAGFAAAAERLCGQTEAEYLLAGVVARHLADVDGWGAKTDRLIGLAEAAPAAGPARSLAFLVLEQPLSEILGSRAGLNEIAGAALDLGGGLAVLTRIAADRQANALAAVDPALPRSLPPLSGTTARLAALMERDAFEGVRAAVARRVLDELKGPRRLRPSDAESEIALLRAMAMVLTAAAGRLFPLEEVREAFLERSKRLVAADFVESFLRGSTDAIEETRALIRLAENVTGALNKAAAARWIEATVASMRFEKAVRQRPEAPAALLAMLAALQKSLTGAGLPEAEQATIARKIGEIGGWVEAESRLTTLLARSNAPVLTRMGLLAKLVSGEAAPLGPVADRARAEILRLVRTPDLKTEVSGQPEARGRLKSLLEGMDCAAA